MVSRKIRVVVNLDELCYAFEDCSVDKRYYLDLEKGEVIYISDEFMDYEKREEMCKEVSDDLGERRAR